MPGKLFIITASSGAGKTSLTMAALHALQPYCHIEQVVTYTSRAPRAGEVDGRDYHFITVDEFKAKLDQNFFLEWSNAYGTYYGSPRSIIEGLAHGTSYCMIVDRIGAQSIKGLVPEAVIIGIQVADLAVLKERLLARGTDSLEVIERRLQLAVAEMSHEREQPIFDVVVMNDQFQVAVENLKAIMQEKLGARERQKGAEKQL